MVKKGLAAWHRRRERNERYIGRALRRQKLARKGRKLGDGPLQKYRRLDAKLTARQSKRGVRPILDRPLKRRVYKSLYRAENNGAQRALHTHVPHSSVHHKIK